MSRSFSFLLLITMLISNCENSLLKNIKQFHLNLERARDLISNYGDNHNTPLVKLEFSPLNTNMEKGTNKNWTVAWSAAPTSLSANSRIETSLYGQKNTLKNVFSTLEIKNRTLQGTGDLKIPEQAGVYEIRFIQDDNLHTIASSGPIILNPLDVNLFVLKKELQLSEKIRVAWQISAEKHQEFIDAFTEPNKDKIDKANPNSKTRTFLCLNLVGSYDDCIWSKELFFLKGMTKVKMPKFAGYFVFRIIIKHRTWKVTPDVECLAVSQIFSVSDFSYSLSSVNLTSVVGSTVKVEWFVSDDAKINRNDWIGLYSLESTKVFTTTMTPLQSQQINLNREGFFDAFLPANSDAGPFIFIYFSNHVPRSVSKIINVQPPKLSCPADYNTMSNIKHLIIICTENHSFEAYFGNYCQSPVNSNPQCTEGPQCCEKAPEEVDGLKPLTLNDTTNMAFDPNHTMKCELCQVNGGKMDGYVKGCFCSDPKNFAIAEESLVETLHNFAREYALADRFFHASAGASCQNNMYLARASYVLLDCTKVAVGSIGSNCWYRKRFLPDEYALYYDPTITSLLAKCGFTLKTYAEGYSFARDNFDDNPCYPDGYDNSDIPHQYYAGILDNETYIADYGEFTNDVMKGTLPEVSFIKPLGIKTGHPLYANITAEMQFVTEVVDTVLNSDYADDTLILYLPDESGGFYDHVATPKTNEVDKVPYGPRIPLLAMGKFAKKNYISHVTMEHSSIVKFIEWNWLNGETGQLNTRDRNVNNIGDLIDPEVAGIEVPNH